MSLLSFFLNEFNGARAIMRNLTGAIGGLLMVGTADKTYSYTTDTNALVNVVDGPGVLVGVLVTVSKAAAVTIYDNASAASGTVIAHIASGAAAGTLLTMNCPFENGIVFQGAGTYPGLTLIYLSRDAAN